MIPETKKFLRYWIPGLSFSTLLALYLWVLRPEYVSGVWAAGPSGQLILKLLALLLGTGVIGYFMHNIHHICLWTIYPASLVPDLRPLIEHAIGNDLLGITSERTLRPIDDLELSPRGAWVVVNVLWHTNNWGDTAFKNATERSVTLWDIMHGSGAVLMSAIVAFGLLCGTMIVWLFDGIELSGARAIGSCLVAIGVILLFVRGQQDLVRSVSGFVGAVASEFFREAQRDRNIQVPITITVERSLVEVH